MSWLVSVLFPLVLTVISLVFLHQMVGCGHYRASISINPETSEVEPRINVLTLKLPPSEQNTLGRATLRSQ